MSNIQVNYTGDGATVLYTITFDYLRRAHVKASINGSNTTGFTFANDTTIQFNSAPANGAAIILFRETPADAVNNTFFPNSSISSESLNDNFRQTLLVSEEAREIAADAQLGNLVPGSIGTVTLADGAVTSVKIADGTIVNADINASAAIADTKLATISTAGKVSNSATTATSSNTVSAIVARDGSGNFSAGTITANLTGTASAIADNIVTSAKIVDGTIVDGDISATAEIAVSKLADGAARQLLQTDAAGTGVEWTDNVDVPGTLDVTGAATLDSTLVVAGDVTVPSLNGGPLAGTRNRIINGDMRIAQRGTSFAAIATGAYSLDRWLWGQVGSMVCTVSQSSDVPNNTFQNSCKVDVTTADTSIAAGDAVNIQQRIEGYNVRDLIGTTFTVSFWVKSPKTGVHCVSVRNTDVPDRSHVKEYTITTANTWEYKTIAVTGGLITAGTWNWTNAIGLILSFSLAAGSTFHTTADAWQTGNFTATANQVNVMDNTSNDFFLTGVQLEPGPVATPFERRPIGTELALCQRYYHRSPSGPNISNAWGSMYASNAGRVWAKLPTTMRAAPSFTALGTTFDRIGSGGTFGTVTNVVVSRDAVTFDGNSLTAAGAFGQPFAFQDAFEVSAEL